MSEVCICQFPFKVAKWTVIWCIHLPRDTWSYLVRTSHAGTGCSCYSRLCSVVTCHEIPTAPSASDEWYDGYNRTLLPHRRRMHTSSRRHTALGMAMSLDGRSFRNVCFQGWMAQVRARLLSVYIVFENLAGGGAGRPAPPTCVEHCLPFAVAPYTRFQPHVHPFVPLSHAFL